MAKSSNASPEMFGFDFQVNATIVLLLDNIKNVKTVRMEGASEDIELTMNDGKHIMAQAKATVKGSSDFSNARSKLSDAIRTLSSSDGKAVEQLVLITNSTNPLKEDTSKQLFYGPPTEVGYNDLSDEAQKVIDDIVEKLAVDFDKNKFQIYYFMFESSNLQTRYKVIEEKIRDFINQLNLGQVLSAKELMQVWQNDILHNGSQTDTTIKLSKKEIVWPVIVLTLGKQMPAEYIDDYDQGFINEVTSQYTHLIDTITERYDLITKILFDYNSSNYSEAEQMTWKYLFTSNLKELSGAVLHKTVFSFRLAYIIEIEKVLGIKLPILLDSPKGKEVDDSNISKMMQILQRDFPDNQIIIASIYHYVSNEHVITLEGQLLDQMIEA